MQILLVEAGIIVYIVAHIRVDIEIIYSVMYISQYTKTTLYIYKIFCVQCAP